MSPNFSNSKHIIEQWAVNPILGVSIPQEEWDLELRNQSHNRYVIGNNNIKKWEKDIIFVVPVLCCVWVGKKLLGLGLNLLVTQYLSWDLYSELVAFGLYMPNGLVY